MSKNNIIEFENEINKLNELIKDQAKLFEAVGVQIKKSYVGLPSELLKQLKEQNNLEIQAEKIRQESLKTLERVEVLRAKELATNKKAQELKIQAEKETERLEAAENKRSETAIKNAKKQQEATQKILNTGKGLNDQKQKQLENDAKEALILERKNKILAEQNRAYNKLQSSWRSAQKALADSIVTDGVKAKSTKALQKEFDILDKKIRSVDEITKNYSKNVGNYASAITGGFKNLLGAFGFVGLLTTGIAVLRDAMKTVVDFDSGMKNVQKTTGLTTEEIDKMRVSVTELSKKLGVVGSVQLTEYLTVAGQLGVKGTENLMKFAEAMAMLEISSNIKGDEGASNVARLLTLTDKGVHNVKTFGDEIVNLGNNFAATEMEILNSATSIAQNTAVYDLGRQSTLAYATALSAVGVEAELAGSKVGKTLKTIESAILSGGKKLEDFAKIADMSSAEFSDLFAKDKGEAMRVFIRGLNAVKVSGGSVVETMNNLGITEERLQRVLSALASEGGYKTLNDALITVKDSTGAMTEEFNTASEKLSSYIAKMGNRFDDFILSIENGSGSISKFFKGFVNGITNVIDGLILMNETFDETLTRLNRESQTRGKESALFDYQDYSKFQNVKNSALKESLKLSKDEKRLTDELTKATAAYNKAEESRVMPNWLGGGLVTGKAKQELERVTNELGRVQGRIQALKQLQSGNVEGGISGTPTEAVSKTLTDKEKRALEKATEDRLKTIAETNKIELSMKIEKDRNIALMDSKNDSEKLAVQLKYNEDYKKLLQLNYNEEVRLAKGNQEKLTLALAKFNQEKQKLNFESEKIQKEASDRQLEQAFELANLIESNELKNEMRSQLLIAKSDQEKINIRLKYLDDQITILDRNEQEDIASGKYTTEQLLKLQEEYNQKRADLENEGRVILKEEAVKTAEMLKSYFEQYTDLGNFGFSSFNFFTKLDKEGKTAFENLLDSTATWGEKSAIIFNSVGEVFKDAMGAMQQSSKIRFDNEMQQLKTSYEVSLLFAGDSAAAKEKLDQDLEEKQKALRIKQAKRDKQMAIMNAVINTAQGVVSMLASVPWPANLVMAGVVGALGAVQIATIASTPIPEFWTGTDNAPQGWALTQERGAEVITDKKGNVKTMGNNKGAQLTFLESGDKVFKSQEDYFKSDLANTLNGNGISHNINVDPFDYNRFDSILAKNTSNTNVNMVFDEDGFNHRTDKRNVRQRNKNYNARG